MSDAQRGSIDWIYVSALNARNFAVDARTKLQHKLYRDIFPEWSSVGPEVRETVLKALQSLADGGGTVEFTRTELLEMLKLLDTSIKEAGDAVDAALVYNRKDR